MKYVKELLFNVEAQVGLGTAPVTSEELYKALMVKLEGGSAHFSYLNDKGELREAYGTLDTGLIPSKLNTKADRMYELLKEIDAKTEPYINFSTATKVMNLVDEIKAGHKPAKNHGTTTQIYWDYDREAFRSFRKENLVAVY